MASLSGRDQAQTDSSKAGEARRSGTKARHTWRTPPRTPLWHAALSELCPEDYWTPVAGARSVISRARGPCWRAFPRALSSPCQQPAQRDCWKWHFFLIRAAWQTLSACDPGWQAWPSRVLHPCSSVELDLDSHSLGFSRDLLAFCSPPRKPELQPADDKIDGEAIDRPGRCGARVVRR